MAHRGRLNVLANIVGKSFREIFREFEGDIDPDTIQGSGDVKYHKGAAGQVRRPVGQRAAGHAGVEPVAPRGGRPGRRGHGARQAGPDRRPRGVPRAAAASSTATPRSPARASWPRRSTSRRCGLPHRRHGAPRHQQPGRLHHHARGGPLVGVRDRRGQDGAGADLPRERRRPRGVRARGAAGVRLPPGVPQGRRHRHVCATAASATTRATSRATRSRRCTSASRAGGRCASSTPRRSSSAATSRSRRRRRRSRTSRPGCRPGSTRRASRHRPRARRAKPAGAVDRRAAARRHRRGPRDARPGGVGAARAARQLHRAPEAAEAARDAARRSTPRARSTGRSARRSRSARSC